MVTALVQLNKLMNELSEEELKLRLSTFKCSRSKDSENFLKKIAIKHEKRSISRTYLEIDDDRIGGYFTLAFKCLDAGCYDLDPDIAELMNINDGIAQAYLVGQLARSDDAERGRGSSMLLQAFRKFSLGKEMFGCRAVRLDCKDELIDYYVSQGFRWIGKNPDKDLNQMVIMI